VAAIRGMPALPDLLTFMSDAGRGHAGQPGIGEEMST